MVDLLSTCFSYQIQLLTDTDSGISEFLIPLLYKGYLKHVLWVKQQWCNQFAVGDYNFMAGDIMNNGTKCQQAAVTLKHTYYIDDSNVCEESDFLDGTNILPISFTVCEPSCIQLPFPESFCASATVPHPPWVLDICLDYFTTSNPFYNHLIELIEADINHYESIANNEILETSIAISAVDMMTIIQNIFANLKFRQMQCFQGDHYTNGVVDSSALSSLEERDHSLAIINQVLNCTSSSRNDTSNIVGEKRKLEVDVSTTGSDVLSDRKPSLQLVEKFLALYPNDFQSVSTVHTFLNQVLPHLSKISKSFIASSQFQLLLPHHLSSDKEIDAHIETMISLIRNTAFSSSSCGFNMCLPSAITIARSSVDGFTPAAQVESIQAKVIHALRVLFSTWGHSVSDSDHSQSQAEVNCSQVGTNKIIVHDLCVDDVRSAAFSLFLHPTARQSVTVEAADADC